MQHRYPSHTIPAPIITEPGTAVEDTAGALSTTMTLASVMTDRVEALQHALASAAPMPDLAALWALADTLEQRLKDSIILLNAVADQIAIAQPVDPNADAELLALFAAWVRDTGQHYAGDHDHSGVDRPAISQEATDAWAAAGDRADESAQAIQKMRAHTLTGVIARLRVRLSQDTTRESDKVHVLEGFLALYERREELLDGGDQQIAQAIHELMEIIGEDSGPTLTLA